MKYIYDEFSIIESKNGNTMLLGLSYYLYQTFQPFINKLEFYLSTELYSRLVLNFLK